MSVRTRFRNKYVTFASFVCGLLLFTYFIILKNYTTSPAPPQAGQIFDGALGGFYQTTALKNLNSGQQQDGGRAPQQVKAGNAWTGLLSSLRFLNKVSPLSNNSAGNYELINKVYNPNAQSHNPSSLAREARSNVPASLPSQSPPPPHKYKWRILCWVLTNPRNLPVRTIYVKRTWGPRCDKTIYMSTKTDHSFPTVGLMDEPPAARAHVKRATKKVVASSYNASSSSKNGKMPPQTTPSGEVLESKQLNSEKARKAWTYIYQHHRNDYDFFYKTDDDTYVVVENLREYLESKDPNQPEFYGHRFILRGKNITYMSGGSGFVLTRRAVELLVTVAFDKYPTCIPKGAGEDWKTARCLQLAGCRAVDTRDSLGRERFLALTPNTHLAGTYPSWYYKYDVDGSSKGLGCCSYYPISFHYIRGNGLLIIDYFLYRMRVLGDEHFVDSYVPGKSKDTIVTD